MSETADEILGSQYALQAAFQTMKERCLQFQKRLAIAEKENANLRLRRDKEPCTSLVASGGDNDSNMLQHLSEKVEQLTRSKVQLTHHIFMVAEENRHLWNRLSRLTTTNKSLGNHLHRISDALQHHPPTLPLENLSYSFKNDVNLLKSELHPALTNANIDQGESSLEDISLKLINSIKLEKSELERQYAEMVEMQSNSDINLENYGYTYPEYIDSDSMEQLKQHDTRASRTKEMLLAQQIKLRGIIETLQTLKKGTTCKGCRKNARKKMCQTGTQFNSDDSLKENGATQTSLVAPPTAVTENHDFTVDDYREVENKVCPLCEAVYDQTASFTEFHEHVLTHFNEDNNHCNDFEIIH